MLMDKIFPFFRKYFFLSVLAVLLICFFYFDLYDFFSLDTLKYYQSAIKNWTFQHYFLSISLYILIFSALIACAIPCATFLTLAGGFLFGMAAIFYSLFSISFGGMVLFLTVRTALGTHLANKSIGWIKKIEHGFKRNAFNYILALRLVPIFPCWITNVGAGILNVPLPTFLGATLLGVAPSSVIYVLAGRGLGKIFTDDKTPVQDILFTPAVMLPLIGLAVLSLIPVIYNLLKKSDD